MEQSYGLCLYIVPSLDLAKSAICRAVCSAVVFVVSTSIASLAFF